MQDFKQLEVWQKAHPLALAIYQVTSLFPKDELYGLTSQMRRASVSISANIAEGCGRKSNQELIHFLQYSLGSARELEYYLLLARDLKMMDDNTYKQLDDQITVIRKMLISLIKRLGDNYSVMNVKEENDINTPNSILPTPY